MTIETVGSFLPVEILIAARRDFERGIVDRQHLTSVEDAAVRDIVERQISCGVPFVTSGELRRNHWANDFWFGLDGISCENVSSGHLYQQVEASTDLIHITGRIGFNREHPFFNDFQYLHNAVANRAKCRQTLPSPANLLLEIYALSEGRPETIYSAKNSTLISDIADAYHQTALRLHELGCDSLQYDDTALGLMCDDNYTKRLLQGGVDLLKLHSELIKVINDSLEGLPADLEKSIYISGGYTIVPEWEHIDYPDNIMPKALSKLNVDKFFIPLDPKNDYAIEVLRHIPKGKKVVLGLLDAHSPFLDDAAMISEILKNASRLVETSCLAVSPSTGFKLSSFATRGLTYEDQWRKLSELSTICSRNTPGFLLLFGNVRKKE